MHHKHSLSCRHITLTEVVQAVMWWWCCWCRGVVGVLVVLLVCRPCSWWVGGVCGMALWCGCVVGVAVSLVWLCCWCGCVVSVMTVLFVCLCCLCVGSVGVNVVLVMWLGCWCGSGVIAVAVLFRLWCLCGGRVVVGVVKVLFVWWSKLCLWWYGCGWWCAYSHIDEQYVTKVLKDTAMQEVFSASQRGCVPWVFENFKRHFISHR